MTSIDKALEVCEVLSGAPRGMSLSDLARALRQPAPTVHRLLAVLIRNAGKVLTHRQLLELVWGPNYAEQTHYLRVYMRQLRHKLETDSARPLLLITEPGVGYRLRAE